MTNYLTVATLKASSVATDQDIAGVEARYPGFTDQQIALASSWIDARLRKRYAAPFASPYPIAVQGWCASIVTERLMRKRGIDATDEQAATYIEDRKTAETEVLEAANAEGGLFDLPLRADTTADGISKGAPLGYSEASPYVWQDRQRDAAFDEDTNGLGSGDQW